MEAGEADALLPQLEALSSLLGEALLERGYAPEQVTVTIGTAGGITGDALRAGGVDGALTESGFLERCYPRRTYIPATEEALEALRDWAAEEGLHGL